MIKPSQYYPFPHNLRLGKYGACCELIDSKNDTSQYIIIKPISYLTEKDFDLIEKGIYTLEELYGSKIKLLGHIPDPNIFWLYDLESFKVERKFHCDIETFNDNCKDIEKFVFDDYNILTEFCKEKYGVNMSDFQDNHWGTTNMPKF
jgi:hypothetical protein